MLEQLFGSRTRVFLLRLFLDHPEKSYFVRELTRLLDMQVYSVRRELENLESLGLLKVVPTPEQDIVSEGSDTPAVTKSTKGDTQKKYYALNTHFILYPELRAVFLKGRLLVEKELVERIQEAGKISYLVLTGMFVGVKDWPTDIFLVGQVNKQKLTEVISYFEHELQQSINYTVMTKQEFQYRREITDRFIFNILEHEKIVVIDRLTAPGDVHPRP